MSEIFFFISFLISPLRRGQAYLDPGSGSFILQLIIASLLGFGLVLRRYWSKIKNIFRDETTEMRDEGDNFENDA